MNETRIKVTNVYRLLQKATSGTIVLPGGAGSSKTYSLCQFFITDRFIPRRNYKLLVLRKTRTANSASVCQDFVGLLSEYGLPVNKTTWNKSELVYRLFGNTIRFAGLDDREKLKSTQWNDIWVEEAFEFSKDDYTFLKTRKYRGDLAGNDRPRIYMSFNPFDCWIFDLEGRPDVEFIYSNYLDNPFVNEEYKKTLEDLKEQDETAYKIYTVGCRASYKHIVYKPYIMVHEFPKEMDETIYGVDFGYNNPTAVLKIGIKDNEFYLKEILYKTKMTNGELIELLNEKEKNGEINKDDYWYADSAEPDRIQELSDAGFNIFPSDKSVTSGLDFCKRQKYYSKVDNVNLNDERKVYKYKEDRNGNILDEPVKFKDHLMDGKRYAIYTHLKKRIEPNLRFL